MDFSVAIPVLEFTIGSTTYRLSDAPLSTASWTAQAKVLSFGTLRREVSRRDGRLMPVEFEVQVADQDGTFRALVEGGSTIKGVAVTLKGYDLSGNSSTRFTGVFATKPSFTNDIATLKLKTDDSVLSRNFMAPITDGLFSDADQAAFDGYVPYAYGSIDSSGYNDKGMVPCPYIDTVLFRYLVSAGFAKDVPNVYKNGVIVASGYSITHPRIAGRRWTLIDFTTDQGTAAISADVVGYEPNATGAGTAYTNPVTILQHLLDNFVYDDYARGNWLSGAAPIDATSWATSATFCDDLVTEAAAYYGGSAAKTGIEAIAEFCAQWTLRCFWKADGTIGLLPDDNRTTDIYFDRGVQRIEHHHFINTFEIVEDDSNCINRVATKFSYSQSQNRYLGNLVVKDFDVDNDAALRLEFTRVAAAAASSPRPMVREMASRILRLYRLPWSMVTAVLPMQFCENELIGDVNVSHPDAPWGNEPEDRRPFRIMWMEEDWTNRRVTMGLRDLKPYLCTYWESASLLQTAANVIEQGRARLKNGCTRTHTRASKAYGESPQGDIVEFANNEAYVDMAGALRERSATNYIKNASFKNGIATNWVTSGTGSAVDDTVNIMFEDTTVSAQSCLITAPNPLAGGVEQIDNTTASVSALGSTLFMLSIDHMDVDSQPLRWELQRSVDSKWYKASDGTWQATQQNNLVTLGSATEWTRFMFGPIDVGASAGTLMLRIRSKDLAGQRNRVQHCQLEEHIWVSSRILTQGAAVLRATTEETISNNSGKRSLNHDRWSFAAVIAPEFDDSVVHANYVAAGLGQYFFIWALNYSGSNLWWFYWDASTQQIIMASEQTGVGFTYATIAAPMARGTRYVVGARMTGSDGELGLAANTVSVFYGPLGGTISKGTDDILAAVPTESSPTSVSLFGNGSGLSGEMWHESALFTQQALTDEDFQKFPLI